MYWRSLVILFLLIGLGCQQGPVVTGSATEADTLKTNSGAIILHNIVVHEEGGLQIARAYLEKTNGSLLNRSNSVQTGEAVFLHLLVRKGWVAKNNLVAIGATQTVATAEGETVLASPDLFAGQQLRKEDASELVLKVVLTKTRKDNHHFIIHYRVWDKNSTGEVKGFYRLQLAANSVK